MFSLAFMLIGSFAFAEKADNKKESESNKENELCTIIIKETVDGREYMGVCTGATCQTAFDCARAQIKIKIKSTIE